MLLEQRLTPLTNPFLDYKDEVEIDCTADCQELERTVAVRRFLPSRFRRRHSIGGYVPHGLSTLDLPKLETDSPTAAAWPDTDDEGDDLCSSFASSPVAGPPPAEGWGPPPVSASELLRSVAAGLAASGALEDGLAASGSAGGSLGGSASREPVVVTTLMIRNLPRVLSQEGLLRELDQGGLGGQYDFVYVPSLFDAGESKGYAFVNFTTPEAAETCLRVWHRGRHCGVAEDAPPLSISPAELQGLEANVRRWSKPRMNRIRNPRFRPFVLDGADTSGGGPASGTAPPSPAATAGAASPSVPAAARRGVEITTMMLRNLPANLTQRELARELDRDGLAGQYDFLYLPSSFASRTGRGYAFVNFLSTTTALAFSTMWDRSLRWAEAPLPLVVVPAEVQGLDQNLARWAGTRLSRIRNPDLRPLVITMPSGAAAPLRRT